ncbi:hypothetical protein V6N12_031417 [Hibiscus sabdariffa]|uniref:Uncharacterized protein n=1 Tax=Hibiscus sabdariffa TaxID=183260 RepID=A0ABR2B3B3_9ROSI
MQMDYTCIIGSSFHPEEMYGPPPSMQMDGQWFHNEQTPDQPRRIVQPPRLIVRSAGGEIPQLVQLPTSFPDLHFKSVCHASLCGPIDHATSR